MSAIPALKRSHIEAAIARIDRDGVPPRRESTKFQLVVDGRNYPPKYVISLAASHATGRELRPNEFSGGDEANGVLLALGFTIAGPGVPAPPSRWKASSGARVPVGPLAPKPEGPPPAPKPKVQLARIARPAPRKKDEAVVVRVVVDGRPAPNARAAGEMLLEAFEKWPTSSRVKFTITPGGFISGRFPSRWSGGIAWDSSARDLHAILPVAEPLVKACATNKVLMAARPRTRVLTIGVDLMSENEHAELVAVIDCDSGEIVRWTGKSYPTGSQEATLVQVADLDSHLLEIADERVLVLGCHDLNMFSSRARANQSPDGIRRKRCNDMARATARFKPTVVLQHPHSTDSANIWRMPWACLARDYPTVRTYASGIAYFNRNGSTRRPRGEVLDGTRSESGVADVIVRSRY